MKVQRLLELASERYPALAESLTLEQLVHFCQIGSEFIRRTHAIFPTCPKTAPIEFLNASLPHNVDSSYWAQLWNITAPSLFACHIDSDKAFRAFGIPSADRPDASFEIPEVVLTPPVDHCLACDPAQHRRLTSRPPMRGYLYDLDGARTVLHNSRYCRGQYHFFLELSEHRMLNWPTIPDCLIYYNHSYYSHGNQRFYYTTSERNTDDIYHVTKHFFVTKRLARSFDLSQMMGQ